MAIIAFGLCLVLKGVAAFHPLIGQKCGTTADCSPDGWEQCEDGLCVHKELWPLKPMEFWGFVVVFGTLWVANMGGVGGAGMLVPILVLFMKFDARNAIALSNFSIFLSSTQRYLLNSGKSHPLKEGKGLLVDYNLGILMLPLIISGVSIGVILNMIIPQLVVIIFYIVFLGFIGSQLLQRAIAIYKKESEALLKVGGETEMNTKDESKTKAAASISKVQAEVNTEDCPDKEEKNEDDKEGGEQLEVAAQTAE